MSTEMANFRTPQGGLARYSEAARRIGVDRSSFMREAVEEKAAAILGQPRPVLGDAPVQQAGNEPVVPTVSREECEHPKAKLKATSFGIKLCTVCGAKIR